MADKGCKSCAFSDIDSYGFPCYLCDQTHNLFCTSTELIELLVKLNTERNKE